MNGPVHINLTAMEISDSLLPIHANTQYLQFSCKQTKAKSNIWTPLFCFRKPQTPRMSLLPPKKERDWSSAIMLALRRSTVNSFYMSVVRMKVHISAVNFAFADYTLSPEFPKIKWITTDIRNKYKWEIISCQHSVYVYGWMWMSKWSWQELRRRNNNGKKWRYVV